MKDLNELIDEIGYIAAKEIDPLESEPELIYDVGFKAGHRSCFDLLAPALKRAIEFVNRAERYDLHLNDPEDTLSDIRAMLEARGDLGEAQNE